MISLFRLLLSFLFPLFALSLLSAQPVIQLNKTIFTLGAIYQGEIKSIPLVVTNTGNQPLIIQGIETSCGCTSAKRSAEAIPPGKSDTITVSFNSLGFYGVITKIVTVNSNDPMQPQIEARLIGTVTSVLEIVPPMSVINFGGAEAGTTIRVSFVFRNTTSEQINIRGISCADSSIRAQISSQTIAPSDSIMIPFTVTPRTKAFMENYFYIETTHPLQLRVPFRFMYIGR